MPVVGSGWLGVIGATGSKPTGAAPRNEGMFCFAVSIALVRPNFPSILDFPRGTHSERNWTRNETKAPLCAGCRKDRVSISCEVILTLSSVHKARRDRKRRNLCLPFIG